MVSQWRKQQGCVLLNRESRVPTHCRCSGMAYTSCQREDQGPNPGPSLYFENGKLAMEASDSVTLSQ